MRRLLEIAQSSFKIALLELGKNKLRTFLSLFGITIGIFCIIGVLATVGSLEKNLQSEIKSLGTNTIYIDKWQYSAGPDYPYWKYVKRPVPQYSELAEIKKRTPSAKYAAFKISTRGNVEALGNVASGINIYGISENFTSIQPVEIRYGRFVSDDEFYRGANTAVIGYTLAESLFGDPSLAPNRTVTIRGQQNVVVGVSKKQGAQLIGGWAFDKSVIVPYQYARTIMDERRADPLIMVQAKDGISSKALQDDLRGSLRAVHKLRPAEEDDFSLNDVADFSDVMSKVFVNVNLGGWIIGALSFIVGIFGVANIMFVTVKERTAQIGVKKALGARKNLILAEFLLESAFLCILGGLVGLLLVFILTRVATAALEFPIFLSPGIIGIAIFICTVAGMLAGIIPALRAAGMNPVEAIRS
jgi:putative ABC transport system permease protein